MSDSKKIPTKEAIEEAITKLRELLPNDEALALVIAEVQLQQEYLSRFYSAWGPHLPPSWREHFEEILREKRNFGLVDRSRR